jgi:dihydroflavonol-4-reductase
MIVVTGGTGFVGSHLLLELLKDNKSIRVIIRKEGNPEKVLSVWKYYAQDTDSLLKKIDWFRCDITDKMSLSEALQDADRVYHCAALVTLAGINKRDMYNANVLGTQNVVNICIQQNVKKLLFVSSIAAIGKSINGIALTEEDGWPVKSKSIYAQTKTLAELEVWRGIAEGLNAVIVNPSVIIGPGDWRQNSCRFFDLVNNGLKYYTKGINGFVDVHDVVRAMIRLMNEDVAGERFILNSENLSVKDLFEKIALALGTVAPSRHATPLILSLAWRAEFLRSLVTGKPARLTRQSTRSLHISKIYSSDKIEKLLNFTFTPIDAIIAQTANCYLREKRTTSF